MKELQQRPINKTNNNERTRNKRRNSKRTRNHFSLNGNFFAKGETVCGEQQVAFSEGGILWNGNLYRELTFTPQDEHASFHYMT